MGCPMKVQCSCGAKYEFEITPEMARRPVQFVCPACATDASDFVDSLVRRELGQNTKPAGNPVPVTGSAAAVPQVAKPRLGLRIDAPSPAAQAASEPSAEGQPCLKHPGQVSTEKCHICSKPICPKCMELFGYFCSPLCKAKAASHGIQVPVFAGQKSVREARSWRKIVWVSSTAGAVVALFLGFWFWYSWFGSIPKSIFSVRFSEGAYA